MFVAALGRLPAAIIQNSKLSHTSVFVDYIEIAPRIKIQIASTNRFRRESPLHRMECILVPVYGKHVPVSEDSASVMGHIDVRECTDLWARPICGWISTVPAGAKLESVAW
jgi:hypothetical protein